MRRENGRNPLIAISRHATKTMDCLTLPNWIRTASKVRNATEFEMHLWYTLAFIWNNHTKYPWQLLFHANECHRSGLPYAFNRIITSLTMDTDAVRCTCKRTISDMQRRKISTTTSFMRGFLSARNTSCMSVSCLSISDTYDTNMNSTSNHGNSKLNPLEKESSLKQRCDCELLTIPGIQDMKMYSAVTMEIAD